MGLAFQAIAIAGGDGPPGLMLAGRIIHDPYLLTATGDLLQVTREELFRLAAFAAIWFGSSLLRLARIGEREALAMGALDASVEALLKFLSGTDAVYTHFWVAHAVQLVALQTGLTFAVYLAFRGGRPATLLIVELLAVALHFANNWFLRLFLALSMNGAGLAAGVWATIALRTLILALLWFGVLRLRSAAGRSGLRAAVDPARHGD